MQTPDYAVQPKKKVKPLVKWTLFFVLSILEATQDLRDVITYMFRHERRNAVTGLLFIMLFSVFLWAILYLSAIIEGRV